MSDTLTDLDDARREVLSIEAQIAQVRARIVWIDGQGGDTTDARRVLGQMEKARRQCIERLGAIRAAIGPPAY